jgi:fatty-acyl-CoA synthase
MMEPAFAESQRRSRRDAEAGGLNITAAHQKEDATNQDRSNKPMIQGLMMHEQLTISQLLDHAAENHGEHQIACFAGAQTVRYNYAALRDRVSRLVAVLRRLGVSQGDRVASLAWNSHRHLELYFAVPALGAVLNTINVRLPAAQVKFILEHSSSKLLFHDATVASLCDLDLSYTPPLSAGDLRRALDEALVTQDTDGGKPG